VDSALAGRFPRGPFDRSRGMFGKVRLSARAARSSFVAG